MSLGHTETNRHHAESSLPDCKQYEPLPYSTQASAIENNFLKTLFYVFNKRFKFFLMQWQNSVTNDIYNIYITKYQSLWIHIIHIIHKVVYKFYTN